MNEVVYIYLKLEHVEAEKREKLIGRMDELLLPIGLRYSGFENMYIPQDSKRRDDIVFDAVHALKTCDWLKGIYEKAIIGNRCFNGELDEIDCSGMTPPRKYKTACYENYYLKTGRLPQAVLVNENGCLLDGYASYLLAQKYHLKPGTPGGADIYYAESGVPYRKIVTGRHVLRKDEGFAIKSKKRYRWIYDIKEPVVPGDVLLVRTKKGKDLMAVDKVTYESGSKNLSVLKKVVKHTGRKIKQMEGRK